MYLILIALSACFYRLGGASYSDFPKLPKWLVRSYTRDVGVTILTLLTLFVLGKWHWSLCPCAVLVWLALRTYHKWLNPFFHEPTTDAYWFNWFAHGLMIGLAFLPYAYFTNTWLMVILRALLMGLFMAWWSDINDDVNWEEAGRGILIIGTLWLI